VLIKYQGALLKIVLIYNVLSFRLYCYFMEQNSIIIQYMLVFYWKKGSFFHFYHYRRTLNQVNQVLLLAFLIISINSLFFLPLQVDVVRCMKSMYARMLSKENELFNNTD